MRLFLESFIKKANYCKNNDCDKGQKEPVIDKEKQYALMMIVVPFFIKNISGIKWVCHQIQKNGSKVFQHKFNLS